MASENPKTASAQPIKFRKDVKQLQRSMTNEQALDKIQETLQPARRRRMSADNTNRIFLPKVSRTSYDDVLPAESWTSTTVNQPVKLQMGERTLGQKPITIMSVLRLNVEKYPERQAYAYKSDDTKSWNYITYKEYLDYVWRAAKGLMSLGLERFSGVAIIGRNAPPFAIANIATIFAGGIVVPISMTISIEDCCSIMQNTHCDILIVGSPKHLKAFEQIRSQLTYIKAIIKYGKGSDETSDDYHKWDDVYTMGDNVADERLKDRIKFQAPNLCCTVIHSPGTAGPPKPVMLSQDNLVWASRTIGRRMSCRHASGVVISIMSYCHVSGLIVDFYIPLLFATTVYFTPTPLVFDWTKEIQPTMLYAPLLIIEQLRLNMTSHLTRSCLSRIILSWAKSIGFRGYKAITSRRSKPICWSLANALVYQKIRIMLGLKNSREIFIGGRMASIQALKFFASLNIPVFELYGMTESAGPLTVSAMPDMFRITSAGKEIEGCSVRIVQPDKNGVGDVWIRGRNVFMGYLNQPEMTNEAFDGEGWFRTGDLARRDKDGFIYISGKVKELVTLANSEAISPEPIETKFREALPFIRNCMLVGKGRTYLALLLTIKTVVNWQTLEVSNVLTPDSRQWFRKLGYEDETIDQFLANPDKRILQKIQSIFDHLNAREQQPTHKIRKWTILPRDFTVQSGELNWTLRIRRFYVEEKYAETIDSLFVEK